jgi:hypothetical protein
MITIFVQEIAPRKTGHRQHVVRLELGTAWFTPRDVTISLSGRLSLFSGIYPWTYVPLALGIVRVLDDQGTLDILDDLARVVHAMGYGDDLLEDLAGDAHIIVDEFPQIIDICPVEARPMIEQVWNLGPHDLDDYVSRFLGPHRVS